MLNIFKYIGYALSSKKGINKPEELVADTSFGLIEGFFILSFVILGLLGIGSLFLGFNYGYIFFKIFGIIMIIILFIDIIIFRAVKKFVGKLSTHVTKKVRGVISNNQTIDVDATDVH